MRVLVGVKRVINYAAKVRVLPDKTAVDLNNVKMAINPFCEIGVGKSANLVCALRPNPSPFIHISCHVLK